MYEFLRSNTVRFRDTFHRSEVVAFSRLQILLAIIWGVLTSTDLSPLINNPKVMTGWLLFSGFVTEYLRRRRQEVDAQNRLVPAPEEGKPPC